jgi:hypothetical protein
MMYVGDSGSWKSITIYIGFSGAWKQVTGAWIGVGGSWKSLTVAPMTASASPTSVSGSVNSSSGTRQNVTTGSTTVTVSGGVGPFTHSWTINFTPAPSTDATGTASVSAPSSTTTSFVAQTCNAANSPGTDFYTAVDTVTDTATGAQTQVSV